jgi:hypothetical protein
MGLVQNGTRQNGEPHNGKPTVKAINPLRDLCPIERRPRTKDNGRRKTESEIDLD